MEARRGLPGRRGALLHGRVPDWRGPPGDACPLGRRVDAHRSRALAVSSRAACAIGAMLVAGGVDRVPVAHRHDPLRTSRR